MNKTYKSIFDPCPQGYRVPPEDTWVGFTTTKRNSFNSKYYEWNMANNGDYDSGTNKFAGNVIENDTYKLVVARGYAFYYQGYGSGNTDFYPEAGQRGRTQGAVFDVGSGEGRSWASCPCATGARHFNYSENHLGVWNEANRASGYPVRCVKEPTQ